MQEFVYTLCQQIEQHFADEQVQGRLSLVARYDRQVEGYFKAEMMVLFDRLGWEWWPEVTYPGGGRCDFVVRMPGELQAHLIGIELKAPFVGQQWRRVFGEVGAGIALENPWPYALKGYVVVNKDSGVAIDIRRLAAVAQLNAGLSLALVLGLAGLLDDNAIDAFREKVVEEAVPLPEGAVHVQASRPLALGEVPELGLGFRAVCVWFER